MLSRFVKTAFCNEDFGMLVTGRSELGQPKTDALYAVLVDIRENRSQSDIDAFRIVVMKRVGPSQFPPKRWAEFSAV